jgi:hypothetical protein
MSIYYKFSQCARELSTEKLDEMAKDFLKKWGNPDSFEWNSCGHFGLENVTRIGCYMIVGYSFDLKSVLRKFVVKNRYGDVRLYYAPNKTALRTCKIATKECKIMEVPIDW